ncbi:MAG TPA: peptidylprolyl isomerase [Gemmatimonadaceae bacterium]|jgi:peptidyl-prolyl cis-trans isomerase A (cyclophilin A)
MNPRSLILALAASAVTALAAVSCGTPVPPIKQVGQAPDSFRVTFETTRGSFVVQVNRAWAPHGADRFYALVQNQFFDGDPFFRVVPGFIAQFGLNLNKKINDQWDDPRIPDDSVTQSNLRGTLTFASEGPNSRNHQLFFNLADKNARLDRTGFAPIGKVVSGMEVVDSLYSAYGDTPEQHYINTMGQSYLDRMFPKLDYIKTVR